MAVASGPFAHSSVTLPIGVLLPVNRWSWTARSWGSAVAARNAFMPLTALMESCQERRLVR